MYVHRSVIAALRSMILLSHVVIRTYHNIKKPYQLSSVSRLGNYYYLTTIFPKTQLFNQEWSLFSN